MADSPLSSQDVSLLIDHLLKQQDPSVTALKKIIKSKKARENVYPLHDAAFPEFASSKRNAFTEEEMRVMKLEKRVLDLQHEMKLQKKQAEHALQVVFSQGKTVGFAQGKVAGAAEAKTNFDVKVEELQKKVSELAHELDSRQKTIYASATHIVLRMVSELVRKVVQAEFRTNPDLIVQVVKKALSHIGERDTIRIRVAAGDWERVSENQDFWMPVSERLENVKIEPDERIEAGGCIIESNSGMVDARLGVQLDDLAGLIEETWRSLQADSMLEGDAESPPGTPL